MSTARDSKRQSNNRNPLIPHYLMHYVGWDDKCVGLFLSLVSCVVFTLACLLTHLLIYIVCVYVCT